MTLIELLVVIAILGVISFALTESIIVGVKTTEGTGARVMSNNAAQALTAYFTADGESADEVFAGDGGSCAPTPVNPADYKVFLHLRWTDRSVVGADPGETDVVAVERSVSYALAPTNGPEQDVVRWACTNLAGDTPTQRTIGHFSQIPDTGGNPVTVSCDPDPALPNPDTCPGFNPGFTPVPSRIQITTAAGDLIVKRRSS